MSGFLLFPINECRHFLNTSPVFFQVQRGPEVARRRGGREEQGLLQCRVHLWRWHTGGHHHLLPGHRGVPQWNASVSENTFFNVEMTCKTLDVSAALHLREISPSSCIHASCWLLSGNLTLKVLSIFRQGGELKIVFWGFCATFWQTCSFIKDLWSKNYLPKKTNSLTVKRSLFLLEDAWCLGFPLSFSLSHNL